eukprot:9094841-Alexandrium_andersonii.AAC.1
MCIRDSIVPGRFRRCRRLALWPHGALELRRACRAARSLRRVLRDHGRGLGCPALLAVEGAVDGA